MNSFYTIDELGAIGFRHLGGNIYVSRKASIYSAENISIGNNVRIDDFCILSGNITLGSYIHIAAYTALYGGTSGIVVGDFANISSRVCIYSVSDDYSGETMTNPMVPDQYKHVESAPVYIGRHAIVGSTSVILPGVTIAEGSAFGSFSFINRDSEAWSLNVGIPFKKIKARDRNALNLERNLFNEVELSS